MKVWVTFVRILSELYSVNKTKKGRSICTSQNGHRSCIVENTLLTKEFKDIFQEWSHYILLTCWYIYGNLLLVTQIWETSWDCFSYKSFSSHTHLPPHLEAKLGSVSVWTKDCPTYTQVFHLSRSPCPCDHNHPHPKHIQSSMSQESLKD